jgi:hypothetical protein
MTEGLMTFRAVLPFLIAQIPSIAIVILGIVLEGRAVAKIYAALDANRKAVGPNEQRRLKSGGSQNWPPYPKRASLTLL